MATADPRFAAWIPVVSAKCIDPFGSLFFCFRQSVKRYIRFLVESVFTVNRRTALSHFPPLLLQAQHSTATQWIKQLQWLPFMTSSASRASGTVAERAQHRVHKQIRLYALCQAMVRILLSPVWLVWQRCCNNLKRYS